MKKILLIILNPLFWISLMALIIFINQISHGGNLVYFKVEVVDSGISKICESGCDSEEIVNYPEDCYYYGGCMKMLNSVNLPNLEMGIILILYLYAILISFLRWKIFLAYFISLIFAYKNFSMLIWWDWLTAHKELGEIWFISTHWVENPVTSVRL